MINFKQLSCIALLLGLFEVSSFGLPGRNVTLMVDDRTGIITAPLISIGGRFAASNNISGGGGGGTNVNNFTATNGNIINLTASNGIINNLIVSNGLILLGPLTNLTATPNQVAWWDGNQSLVSTNILNASLIDGIDLTNILNASITNLLQVTNITMPSGGITFTPGSFIGVSNSVLCLVSPSGFIAAGSSVGKTDGSFFATLYVGGLFSGSGGGLTNLYSTNIAYTVNTNQLTYLSLADGLGVKGTLGNTNLIPNFGTNVQDFSVSNGLCFSNGINLASNNYNWITYYLNVTNTSAAYPLSFDKMVANSNLLGGLTNGYIITNGVWTLEVFCTGTNILNERWFIIPPNSASSGSSGVTSTFDPSQFKGGGGSGTNIVQAGITNNALNLTNYQSANLIGLIPQTLLPFNTNNLNLIITNSFFGTFAMDKNGILSTSNIVASNVFGLNGVFGQIVYTNTVTNVLDAHTYLTDGLGTQTGAVATWTNWPINIASNYSMTVSNTTGICFSNIQGLKPNVMNTAVISLLFTNQYPAGIIQNTYISWANGGTSNTTPSIFGWVNGESVAFGTSTPYNQPVIFTVYIFGTNWMSPQAVWIADQQGAQTFGNATSSTTVGQNGVSLNGNPLGGNGFTFTGTGGVPIAINNGLASFFLTSSRAEANVGGSEVTRVWAEFASPGINNSLSLIGDLDAIGSASGKAMISNFNSAWFGGTITSSNGFASYATNTALVVSSTGMTNATTNTYRLFGLQGVSMTFSNSASPSFINFSLGTISVGGDNLSLNPGESIFGTGISVVKAIAQ